MNTLAWIGLIAAISPMLIAMWALMFLILRDLWRLK